MGAGVELISTVGDRVSPTDPCFQFLPEGHESYVFQQLAFTVNGELLVTDPIKETVHVIDIDEGYLWGHVAPFGSIPGPEYVAAHGALMAVSSWKDTYHGAHTIRLFTGARGHWEPTLTIGGDVQSLQYMACPCPSGLRFSDDGSELAVSSRHRGDLNVFDVADGRLLRRPVEGRPFCFDVEVCEGGWLVVSDGFFSRVLFVHESESHEEEMWRPLFAPRVIAGIPGVGYAVLDNRTVNVFAADDVMRMRTMSQVRISWMVAVARTQCRAHPGL